MWSWIHATGIPVKNYEITPAHWFNGFCFLCFSMICRLGRFWSNLPILFPNLYYMCKHVLSSGIPLVSLNIYLWWLVVWYNSKLFIALWLFSIICFMAHCSVISGTSAGSDSKLYVSHWNVTCACRTFVTLC